MKRDITWWQVIAVCILIAGVLLTIWSAQRLDQSMRTDLLTKTNIAKSGITVEQVTALNGSPADLVSPGYLSLKAQLERIRAADPDIRFVYLMSQRADGSIIFNADSEPPESADYSPPGQVYTEAPAAVMSAFATGARADEGPFTDRWGTWVSGFIPVTDPSTGHIIAVFGMDTDARDWNSAIFRSSLPLIIATLLIVLLVLVTALFQLRNDEEKHRLETSEEKFSKVFQANPALMIVSTIEESRILDVNKSFLSTLGYSRDEVIGRTTVELDLYVDLAQRNTILNQVRETGQVQNMEVALCRKNRDLLFGSLTSITIDISGTARLFTAILDQTERKQAGDALRQANKKLNLLSGITRHDINNQLTILMGYLGMLEEQQPDPKFNEYFLTINTAAERITAMIQFTKEYDCIGVNAPFWQDCRTLVDTATKQVHIGQVMVKNDIPAGFEIFADPLIVKVCYNLMDNAVRYGGKITTIRFSVLERRGEKVIVCEDDGNGIPAGEKEKIFERGYGKNTGLGLALAREILDITGITLIETGEPGNGARFEMTVPKRSSRLPVPG